MNKTFKNILNRSLGYLPFALCLVVLCFTASLVEFTLLNGAIQLVLFAVVVCIPTYLTKRMSYVDIGWPWGLVLLGVLSYWFSDGYWLRSLTVSAVVILIGLRMGIGALNLWRLGLLQREFPRYQYQHIRFAEEGKTNTALALQVEALSQGLANASFLALPILIIASNTNPQFSLLELVGLAIWFVAFTLESVADFQKVSFLAKMKREGKTRQVCDVGLWRYCRHPNYFYEWMVWNGIAIAAIPSWLALQDNEHIAVWVLLGVSLVLTSRAMYSTLVYTTGAVPSEYFSMQKRPDYPQYQARTNRFFPGPQRRGD